MTTRSSTPSKRKETDPKANETAKLLRLSAVAGVVVWLVHRLVADADLITSTLVVAVLVVVPLGLSLVPPNREVSALDGWIGTLQPFAAVGAVAALSLESGGPSALFVLPWFVLTVLSGVKGLVGWRRAGAWVPPAELWGLSLLPIGGAWLVASRAGLDPLTIGTLMAHLTAVHFHFAAFGGLVLIGLGARRLSDLVLEQKAPKLCLRLVAFAQTSVFCGVFLVALGIAEWPVLGVVGAAALTLGLFVHALLQLIYVLRRQPLWVGLLLFISAFSVMLSMPLALLWAWGTLSGAPLIDMSWMLRLHGMANAHGFVLAGLCGWWADERLRMSRAAASPKVIEKPLPESALEA